MAKAKVEVVRKIDWGLVVSRINKIAKRGFSNGVGDVGNLKNGTMCVEAAICTALDEVPRDEEGNVIDSESGSVGVDLPSCVPHELVEAKIMLNDEGDWRDDHHRAEFLLPLAIAQLATKGQKNIINRLRKAVAARWNALVEQRDENAWKKVEHAVKARETEAAQDFITRVQDLPDISVAATGTLSGQMSQIQGYSSYDIHGINGHDTNGSELACSVLLLALKDVKSPGSKHVRATAYKKAEKVLADAFKG